MEKNTLKCYEVLNFCKNTRSKLNDVRKYLISFQDVWTQQGSLNLASGVPTLNSD